MVLPLATMFLRTDSYSVTAASIEERRAPRSRLNTCWIHAGAPLEVAVDVKNAIILLHLSLKCLDSGLSCPLKVSIFDLSYLVTSDWTSHSITNSTHELANMPFLENKDSNNFEGNFCQFFIREL